MTPDYEKAALAAMETLIKYGIDSAPVDPLWILKHTPGVAVMTFSEVSSKANVDRSDLMDILGCENQDAVTTVHISEKDNLYYVAFNRMLPSTVAARALARELGHIVLGHDGTRTKEVRYEEAKTFALHLLCPRPLIHSLQATGIRMTDDVISDITGFDHLCMQCLRKLPQVNIPVETNRKVRDQMKPYTKSLFEYYRYAMNHDVSALADLGSYMDGYEE